MAEVKERSILAARSGKGQIREEMIKTNAYETLNTKQGKIDKQTLVAPNNGMLLSSKKDQIIDTQNNLNKSQRHYVK